jgi:hypothetical protein
LKYICESGHVFSHPCKIITGINNDAIVSLVESYNCPIPECHNIKFSEYVEVPEELSDVISVPYEGVAVKLAEGYKVVEIYAKTITLKLPKPKSKQPDPDDNQAFIEQAYKKLEGA